MKSLVPLVLSTSLLALLQVSPVTAGTKCASWPIGCAQAKNSSPWEMRVTKIEDELYPKQPHDKKKTPDLCKFHNWGASPIWGGGHEQTVWCSQIWVLPGTYEGGRNDHDDVDGITFPYDDWYLYGKKYTKGVWVKIFDGDEIICSKKDGKPKCGQGNI